MAEMADVLHSAAVPERARAQRREPLPAPDVTSFQPPISPPVPTVEAQLFGGPMVAEPVQEMQEMDQGDSLSVHSEGTPKHYKTAAQALRLPDISTNQFKSPPSAFSRVPSIPQLYDLGSNPNVRDSVFTTQSGGSSSIYPPSTSTASGTESPPSPRSIAEQLDNNDVASFDPELDKYDGDDVSTRLRLLVSNNYFLPPAHSKPSPSDFANAAKKARPPTTPTFFDFFRKSRSKPSTPTGTTQTFDLLSPALRTPSDQTTVSPYPPSVPRRRSSSQAPPLPGAPPDPSGRVVVVREKMHDIASAARQAEQEMKLRGARQESLPGHNEVDVIDPTDAVDLPPPSAAYPFAVQASALHEMGVQESVGAALLADRLPPRSPSGLSPVEDEWRKALLHAAVNHSLNNSSVVSSPRQAKPISPESSPDSEKRMLGQRIISPPLVDEPRISSSGHSMGSHPDAESDVGPRASSTLPLRVETPCMPMTPLAPPPRRLVNPLYSISQTSLPIDQDVTRSPSSAQVRTDDPTPRLSDAYEADVGRHAMLSPPLVIREPSEGSSGDRPRTSSDSNDTFYSEEEPAADADVPRPSMSSSIPENRPSLSIYSQPSPTTSAFQDAIRFPPVVNPPPRGSSLRGSLDHPALRQSLDQQFVSAPSPVPRDSMASPPPRVSSSLAHVTPLSPPPRSSSFAQRMAASARIPPPPLPSDTPEISEEILDPGPSTPPFPISDRRGTTSLVLEIPQSNTHQSIRSAPAPSSPPSFFDALQNQPNAMDDLDSSSDEDEDSYLGNPSPPQTPIFVDQRTRAVTNAVPSAASSSRSLLMRLGNHSTPYVSRSAESSPISSKKAVGHVPAAGSFFKGGKSGKSDQGHGPPTSTFDFFQYTQQHPLASAGSGAGGPSVPRRPQTSGGQAVREWQSGQKVQEELRQLDGLLIQHMEAEKDKIRRIATTLQSTAKT
ncbi:hypothetical protein MVEN_02490400 [Mycena venus]|uniref:Uncharacterized protein n=1 Tax=Mycena venus TaxID=2733690 RepID=A0A8H6WXM1_9AGAR|nr:hypothetical protein MVEN_02490400 [Mycena venus]